jgi:signal transduction histidine kinase/ligand-binding sensor domain-containing protein
VLVAGSLYVQALEPTTPLANYGRQAWVMENGLPQNTVQALVQSRDGFIWMGTEVGLVRFDGYGFQIFDRTSSPALTGNDVQCLLAASDGSLWIGTSEGLARWKDGVVTPFSVQQGLPGNSVIGIFETAGGSVWVWTEMGFAHLDGDKVVQVEPGSGIPSGVIESVAGDGAEGLMVQTTTGLAANRSGAWSALPPQSVLPNQTIHFYAAPVGTMRAIASKTTVAIQGLGSTPLKLTVGHELPGSRIQALFCDREGTLWIGTNAGLSRWINSKLERLPVTDSLASASVLTLMEDREGNLWVGTETGGLHILRDQRFQLLKARDKLSPDNTTAVVEDTAGTLWVGTSGGGLNALRPSPAPPRIFTVRQGMPSDVILSLAAAPNGDLWVGTPDGLSRIHGDAVTSFTSADGLPDDFIRSLLADADGSLWIGTRRGLTHWILTGGATPRMETFTRADGLGSDLVGALARDPNGDLWVATFAGLARLHNGEITNFTTANGLSSNVITALLARTNGTMLIGTQDHGWNLWDGQRFTHTTRSGLDKTTVRAILDDGRNHLWFATGSGIARCDCAGIPGAMEGLDCLNWIEFGTADGLISRDTATNSHPSAWRGNDGRLWFATPKGLQSVDPAHFPVNTVPPPVALERFAVDDQNQPLLAATDSIRVPSGRNHFQFDYAGMSFIAPQKVRYRFMLEGFDHGWTEAGARRTAYYTNIPPGRYTFRVQAANNDGLWNTQGAALHFELRPHFYQTVWFYMLLALIVAGLVFLFLRLRLLRAEREFKAVLGERNRIAREIHDTLAQGYVGISVQLEVLTELLRHNKIEAAAKHLDTTRGYVREGLADARQSIWSLRSHDAGETTMPVRLRRLVEQADGRGLEARFGIFGAYRPMPPGIEREFLRIAQEALHNVKKHAEASSVQVQLEYGPSEISMEIRDNGRGFEVNHGAQNGAGPLSPPGHYGLTGMRERAKSIHGTLEITSETGVGTTVRLRAPSPKEISLPKEAKSSADKEQA